MATPKPQPTRAIAVIPSSINNIPNPALQIASGTVVDLIEGNIFVCDGTVDFTAIGLKAGDIVYVPGAPGAATVTGVVDANSFSFNVPHDPLALPVPINLPYNLYNGEDNNQGCVLYVGTGGSLVTITAGGDEAIYENVQAGTFIPVQTLAVTGGLAENIIALW